MQIELPQDFVRLMHEHYDAETADALCNALDTTEPEVSIRLNPRKLSAEEVLAHHPELEPVPWCPNAFYLPDRPAFTFDPLLHAGAYYVQEASSMYIASLTPPLEGMGEALLALDLCAAPGGKSTLLQSLLPEGSLLISNEPIAKRAQILSENMQKWMTGQPEEAPQVIVTQNYPAEFGMLTGQVDILLTDVPCSGEGMFRKDEVARQEWSLENVRMCQQRQRDILQDIWHVLKPGGLLIYSTCTFNRFEDEDNARWICSELGGELLMERHFLPGRDRGEGFYVAAIRTPSLGEETSLIPFKGKKGINKYGLRILYDGEEYFSPPKGGWGVCISLSYNEALQYLRREALRVEAPRGPVTLCYRGLVLGPGKGVGNRINNLYPEAWRIRTTYTTPFSLLGIDEPNS
ncbi:MAG: hypothetical protein IK144_01200 [Bacteroidaceae bacterium]|nr:hypothetical protein [Bacteroidaceae bacterium]